MTESQLTKIPLKDSPVTESQQGLKMRESIVIIKRYPILTLRTQSLGFQSVGICSQAGMSEIAIREKINGTGRDGTRLNGNGIGLENTVDYCS